MLVGGGVRMGRQAVVEALQCSLTRSGPAQRALSMKLRSKLSLLVAHAHSAAEERSLSGLHDRTADTSVCSMRIVALSRVCISVLLVCRK